MQQSQLAISYNLVHSFWTRILDSGRRSHSTFPPPVLRNLLAYPVAKLRLRMLSCHHENAIIQTTLIDTSSRSRQNDRISYTLPGSGAG